MWYAIILESIFQLIILEYGRPNQKIFPPISLLLTAYSFDLCLQACQSEVTMLVTAMPVCLAPLLGGEVLQCEWVSGFVSSAATAFCINAD